MAAPSKKRVVVEDMKSFEKDGDSGSENESEGSIDEEQSEKDDDTILDQEVQVEFEAMTPDDSDFHGIRRLLQQVFLKANIDISKMTDLIISQNFVGSVIKQCEVPEEMDDDDSDDDDEVFGVITAINVTQKNDEFIQQLVSTLSERCTDKEKKGELSEYFNNPSQCLGLLINERFINIPPQIAVPTFQSLRKEIENAKVKDEKFDFKYFMMITKTNVLQSKGKKKKKNMDFIFQNAEEELFYEESTFNFSYCVNAEKDTAIAGDWDEEDEEMDSYRTVLIFQAEKFDLIMNKMVEVLG